MENLAAFVMWFAFGVAVIPRFAKDVLEDINYNHRPVELLDVACLGGVITAWLMGILVVSCVK